MPGRAYKPILPQFVSRLELTWEYTKNRIEEFLELYPLNEGVCRGCFLIFMHSLFSYLLPDTVLLQENRFCELQEIYTCTCSSYHKARREGSRSAQSLIYDFELRLYNFTEKHFDCSNELVHKHIIQLIDYQKKVWEFCMTHDRMDDSPLPYHQTCFIAH